MTSEPASASVILATDRAPFAHSKSVFLAGTTAKVAETDWRITLTSELAPYAITVINPFQPNWGSSWREDISDSRFRDQVEWELDMQERADVVAVFFHPASQASISLLELGLSARSGKTVVVGCPDGFWKKGNVQVVCRRFGIPLLESEEDFRRVVVEKVAEMTRG